MSQLVYMLVVVKYGAKKRVSEALLKFREIENIHELYGQYDIILKIREDSLSKIENFIQKHIRTMPEIERTETLVVSDIPKEG